MAPSTIFVTGATGFIGSQTVAHILKAGYYIRLSVRKESQISTLKIMFAGDVAKLDFVVIPDMTVPDVFDQPLQGIDYVFHIASPMPTAGDDFVTDYVNPAVQGTLAVLEAAEKSPPVKRVVIVSSICSLIPLYTVGAGTFHAKEGANKELSEPLDLNMKFRDDDIGGIGGAKYHASKLLSHSATLDWVRKREPHFNVITLHPSFVVGHSLIQTSAEKIDALNALFYGTLLALEKAGNPTTVVDVKDVAVAHLKALDLEVGKTSEVQEFLLNASGWEWGRLLKFVKEKHPDLPVKTNEFDKPEWSCDTRRAEDILGMRWRSMEDTMSDLFDQQLQFAAKA